MTVPAYDLTSTVLSHVVLVTVTFPDVELGETAAARLSARTRCEAIVRDALAAYVAAQGPT